MDHSDAIVEGLTVEEERTQLDAKIHELEVVLTNLRRRRNSLLSISKIPADVLLQIFSIVIGYDERTQLLDLDRYGIQKENRLQMSWIRTITHVCSTWRDLALDSPSIWTRIRANSKQDIVLETLRRSKTLPLSLSFMFLGGGFETLDAIIQNPNHIQRIKHLELGLAYYSAPFAREKLQCFSPTNLETCSLSTTGGGTSNTFRSAWLPAILLQRSKDTLRCLQVSRCTFDFVGVDRIISFPHLSEFRYFGPHSESIALLTRISFPPTCSVSLSAWFHLESTQSLELKQVIQRIWSMNTAGVDWDFRVLEVSENETCFSVHDKDDLAAKLIIEQLPITANYFLGWFEPFSLQYITTLRIGTSTSFPEPVHWKYFAERCSNVTTISLSLDQEGLASWLQDVLYIHDLNQPSSSSSQTSNEESNVPTKLGAFLNLERLECFEPSGTSFRLDPSTHGMLLGCVKQRYEMGIPVKYLTLRGISTAYIHELAPYVDGEIFYETLDDRLDEEYAP